MLKSWSQSSAVHTLGTIQSNQGFTSQWRQNLWICALQDLIWMPHYLVFCWATTAQGWAVQSPPPGTSLPSSMPVWQPKAPWLQSTHAFSPNHSLTSSGHAPLLSLSPSGLSKRQKHGLLSSVVKQKTNKHKTPEHTGSPVSIFWVWIYSRQQRPQWASLTGNLMGTLTVTFAASMDLTAPGIFQDFEVHSLI